MSPTFYLLSTDPETGDRNITVFVPGESAATADDSHCNFQAILDAVQAGEPVEDILPLFDVAETVEKYFDALSDRVSVKDGRVYLDGDEIHNALTEQILRFLREGQEDWMPLVLFFENVLSNPQEHSRDQLFEWLDRHAFAIDSEGYFIAYKGLTASYKSIHAGPGIVNGEVVEHDHLDNSVGNIVEIARSTVAHDPARGCASGLHVGTWAFASTFGSGVTVKVRVNPRDVVSVPTDCNAQKVRVCRYEVLNDASDEFKGAYAPTESEDVQIQDGLYDEDDCDDCDGTCDEDDD